MVGRVFLVHTQNTWSTLPARPLANGNCLFAYMIGRRRHNGWPYWGCLIAICTASIPFAILYKTHQFLPFLCTTLQKLDHQATHYRLHVTRTRSIVAADWAVVWSQTFDLRRRPVSDQKKIGLGLGLAGLVLCCCETRSCHTRRHNDPEGHSSFSSTIYSFSILYLEHHYRGD